VNEADESGNEPTDERAGTATPDAAMDALAPPKEEPTRQAQIADRYEQAAARGRGKRGKKRGARRANARTFERLGRSLGSLPLEQALAVQVSLLCGGSVLAVGGVHPAIMGALGAVAAVALATALLLDRRRAVSGPALVFWALSLWCVLQLVPLPMGWLAALAPANADVWQRALLPFGEAGPAFASISLDRGATAIEALRWFGYGAMFSASAVLASRRGARWVVGLVFAVAVITAGVTILHGLTGMKKVYGIYQPTFAAQPWHVGPLLNPNNLGGLLNLGALCGLGLLLADDAEAPWPAAIGVALLVGVDVISASRGGVAVLILGVLALAILVEVSRERHVRVRSRLVVGVTLVAGVGLALLAGRDAVWRELLDENLSKLEMLDALEPAVRDFPLLGMGRGAFESVFQAYQQQAGGTVFHHAENFVAQWVIEWGAPAALAALLAFGFFFRPRRMGVGKSSVAAGAWIGVMALLLQNLVDLGLEIPGLCFAAAAVLGGLWGDRGEPAPQLPGPDRPARPAPIGAALALAAGIALVAGAIGWGLRDVSADRRTLRAELMAERAPRSPERRARLEAELRAAMLRHPAEPYFALLGGQLAWEEKDPQAIAWLQRALERSMVNGRAHLLLARVLHRYGATAQALLELRLAVESEQALLGPAATAAARWTRDPEELARAVPGNKDAAWFWEALGARVGDRKLGAICDERALALDERRVDARIRLGKDLIDARAAGSGCKDADEARCAGEIEAHAEVIARERPKATDAAQLRARWLSATGKPSEAAEMLATACDGAKDEVRCLQTRAEIAAQIPDAEPFATAVKGLRRAACATGDACGSTSAWIGDMHAQRGEHAAAVTAYEQAVKDDPTEDRLAKLADAALKAGLGSRAVRALERLRDKESDPVKRAKLEERRRDVMQTLLR
jgi:tetratricopeptide (TPR) repeat protein